MIRFVNICCWVLCPLLAAAQVAIPPNYVQDEKFNHALENIIRESGLEGAFNVGEDGEVFSHKTGWWSYYTHDTGIVDDGEVKYIISLFTPVTEEDVRGRMKDVSQKVYHLIRSRHPKK